MLLFCYLPFILIDILIRFELSGCLMLYFSGRLDIYVLDICVSYEPSDIIAIPVVL